MELASYGQEDLREIIDHFVYDGQVEDIRPFGSGHINDTYRVFNTDSSLDDYLLQRINHHVFADVKGMMDNIHQVTEHIRHHPSTDWTQETLQLHASTASEWYTMYRGAYWRMFDFRKNTKSYDLVETAEQAYQGARAFGVFFRLLSDLPVEQLTMTLPEFHNIILRLRTLEGAVKEDTEGRAREVQAEIYYARSIADQMCQIEHLKQANHLPLRVTHNDTKFNNVLLDAHDRGVCVIDLDTVMPGVIHYDFGDGIRTSANTAQEDESDLACVQLDLDKFEAFASGYLEVTRDVLTPTEIEYLGMSGALMSYLMAVRFLTDYLQGDRYYKTTHPLHNLDRARCQLELTRQILAQQEALNHIIRRKV
ncbi:hypothetical protein BFP72_00545 [Reichenbachiella sp. 5M10]|uniref:phosphotransferase enzyme family protein n=1 Tax=Reichenbachiella sp. 5M10 TaxID=1889772 RepID=UPI000C14FFFF|nr:aminoglycoside phosphotransferase family protein [Reichenbachiella sp. 5M10]PIB34022.1 hypothetical protein BFP72_00545 [Reichenbachiella sp. 5M10]